MWKLPIGAINKQDNDPLQSAQRELREETGYTSTGWTRIGTVHGIKGPTNHAVHTYIARNIVPDEAHIEHDEAIDGLRFISKDFFEEMRQGIITDEETIAPIATFVAHAGLL